MRDLREGGQRAQLTLAWVESCPQPRVLCIILACIFYSLGRAGSRHQLVTRPHTHQSTPIGIAHSHTHRAMLYSQFSFNPPASSAARAPRSRSRAIATFPTFSVHRPLHQSTT